MIFDVEIPKWAKYVSQDEDGLWYVWSHIPILNENGVCWIEDFPNVINFDSCFDELAQGIPPKDYTQELYEVIWK